MDWRKSSFSGQNGSCIETASNSGDVCRDSSLCGSRSHVGAGSPFWRLAYGGRSQTSRQGSSAGPRGASSGSRRLPAMKTGHIGVLSHGDMALGSHGG